MRGWVKIYSYTDPIDRILQYRPWLLRRQGVADWNEVAVTDGRIQGRTLIARLSGIPDRDEASRLVGSEIAIDRSRLPALPGGEYYWIELIGLSVSNLQGQVLGRVDHMMATGVHDVMIVHGDRERLIPFADRAVVQDVDLERGVIVVDWDPDF